MNRTQMANQILAGMQPKADAITIADAAAQWIAMIESPNTKATPEQKAALIAKIRDAALKVKRSGAESFVMACNDIKAVMNA